jgi:FkbH-like protein
MMRAQLARKAAARRAVDPERFLESLELACEMRRIEADDELERVHELVLRTNQFNTTGRRYSKQALRALSRSRAARIYTMRVKDRFADYGLVAACICEGQLIELFVMSCRVIGLGVEHRFLRFVLEQLRADFELVEGRLIASERNLPARALFRDNGFSQTDDTTWRLSLVSTESRGARA